MKNQKLTNLENEALQIYIRKLENENIEMQKLSTRKGFYEQYFDALKKTTTKEEAFNQINEKFNKLFGRFRYSDYSNFKIINNF